MLTLEHDLLNLIERDLVVAPIIELGRARALMRGHLLRMFEQPAIREIDRDAGGPEGVAAELGFDAGSPLWNQPRWCSGTSATFMFCCQLCVFLERHRVPRI